MAILQFMLQSYTGLDQLHDSAKREPSEPSTVKLKQQQTSKNNQENIEENELEILTNNQWSKKEKKKGARMS